MIAREDRTAAKLNAISALHACDKSMRFGMSHDSAGRDRTCRERSSRVQAMHGPSPHWDQQRSVMQTVQTCSFV